MLRGVRTRSWAVAALVSVLVGVAACSATAAPAGAHGPLVMAGHGFLDPQGRTVVLHGLFASWKTPPYYPPDDPTLPNGFTAQDADIVRNLGFDVVRLGWFWEGLQPQRGVTDPAYLEGIAAVQAKLSQRDVHTVLDAHQDLYTARYSGYGLPDWATFDDGIALGTDLGFPGNYGSPAIGRAFENLYADRGGVIADFGRAWQVMARRLSGDPMLLGYDLMNEPWPGSQAGACTADAGCPTFDRTVLQPFETRLALALRKVDRRRPVFYEPTIFFNQGKPNGFTAPPRGVAPAGLSFHDQCPTRVQYQITKDPLLIEQGHMTCPAIDTRTLRNADAAARAVGGAPLMTEVAPTADADTDGLNCLLERADRFQIGWTYGLGWRRGELRTLDGARRLVLARAYPRAIAGTPQSYAFDVRTGRLTLRYRPASGVRGATIVMTPAVQYPAGYVVQARGATVTSSPGAPRLTLVNVPGASSVSVTVAPAPGDSTERPQLIPCPV